MVWKPHVTVAAVIERDGCFLLVEETTDKGLAFNQPAGHLEPGETLIAAVTREVLEETAWHFTPEALVAVQLWRKTPDSPTFVRFCFTGSVLHQETDRPLDEDINAIHWLSREEIQARQERWRSPLVWQSIEAYCHGERYPLSLLQSFLDLA